MYKEDNMKYLTEMEPNKTGQTMGLIKEVKKIQTKKGDNMAFITVTDATGVMSGTLFPETYRAHLKVLQEGQLLVLSGKLDNKRGKDKESLIIQKMIPIETYISERENKPITCFIRVTSENEEKFDQLKELLKANPGRSRTIVVDTVNNRKILLDQMYHFNPTETVINEIKKMYGLANVVVK
ncbi:OB-fold nucleic acid binding domain-containing protein [Jeotgalibaca porci]|uniref:OB-fold nucleic acid binding domain-containing protein n=1 Tax=Jeotgalibaca porci TaxID=1868793 RepID=UPI0035A01450